MTGRERVEAGLAGKCSSAAILPILHSGLAPLQGVALADYFTQPQVMAQVTAAGAERFDLDGVQLSLGVTAEAEALGAAVEQPTDGGTVLKERLLADTLDAECLRGREVCAGGRLPGHFEAVAEVVEQIGQDRYVLATLRGPLLLAAQLRGVEKLLMDAFDQPEAVAQLLEFTADVAIEVGRHFVKTGAHGLVLGEATCSPNFISPAMYRNLVVGQHRRIVEELRAAGWSAIGWHICGGTEPIIEDVVATGADFLDVDHAVDTANALKISAGRMAFRGNLDPSSVFRFGAPAEIEASTRKLAEQVRGERWVLSSGCDIPPGTPAENIEAFVRGCREGAGH